MSPDAIRKQTTVDEHTAKEQDLRDHAVHAALNMLCSKQTLCRRVSDHTPTATTSLVVLYLTGVPGTPTPSLSSIPGRVAHLLGGHAACRRLGQPRGPRPLSTLSGMSLNSHSSSRL
jgi:hypothetical protein